MTFKLNLQRRSVLTIALLLFLAVSLNTAVLTYIAMDKYEEAILSRAASVGEGVRKEVQKAIELGLPLQYIDGLNEKLAGIAESDETLSYSMITDTKGVVLFHSDETKTGTELKDGVTARTLSISDAFVQSGNDSYDIAMPVSDAEGKILGILRVGVRAEVIRHQLYKLLQWAVGATAASFSVFVLLVYFAVSKFIAVPIMDMEKAASMISAGDLTKKVEARGKDEILSLSDAVNKMTLNLRGMITKIMDSTNSISGVVTGIADSSGKVLTAANVQKTAINETARAIDETNEAIASIAISSENLSESSQDATSAVLEMTMSISRVAESANFFSDAAQDTASSIEEMTASIREIAKSLDVLSSSSEDTASALLEVNATIKEIEQSADDSVRLAEKVSADASEKGMSAVSAASKGMEEIREKVGTLADAINRLEARSEEIGQILTVIDDVADQTNLLALNAAILAAQAGEHGVAFAVVADEIKALAERTSVSTKEISNLIASVQAETRSSVEMTAEGLDAVNKGIKLVSEVNSALRSIHESSMVSTEMSRAIRRATQEEANVIRQITDAIKGMTDQIEHISRATKEQTRGSKMVLDAAEKIKELSQHIKNATSEQLEGGKQISEVSENVHAQAEHITKAISSQKQKSADIARSVGKIQEATKELDDSSRELNQAVDSIKEATRSLLAEIQKFLV